ncbi:hypothetical protein ABVT39_018736 [Epinephelus coioides]
MIILQMRLKLGVFHIITHGCGRSTYKGSDKLRGLDKGAHLTREGSYVSQIQRSLMQQRFKMLLTILIPLLLIGELSKRSDHSCYHQSSYHWRSYHRCCHNCSSHDSRSLDSRSLNSRSHNSRSLDSRSHDSRSHHWRRDNNGFNDKLDKRHQHRCCRRCTSWHHVHGQSGCVSLHCCFLQVHLYTVT